MSEAERTFIIETAKSFMNGEQADAFMNMVAANHYFEEIKTRDEKIAKLEERASETRKYCRAVRNEIETSQGDISSGFYRGSLTVVRSVLRLLGEN